MDEIVPQQIDVFSPEGELGTLPLSEVKQAVQAGYKLATPDELKQVEKVEKFEQPLEQLKTFGEGAASAATFGLSTGVQRILGSDPEDIQARREINPGVYGLGQVTGLVGSAFIPGGAAGQLTRAGEAAALATGIGKATTTAKIGSRAVQEAAEAVLFQAGDEFSKTLASDPNQSVETAIANVGLSGLLGGAGGAAIGSVSPLWKATAGPKVQKVLDLLTKRTGGIESQIDDDILDAMKQVDIDIDPQIKSAISDNQYLRTLWAKTIESTSDTAINLQSKKNKFIDDSVDYVASKFGKTEKDLKELVNVSEDQIGQKIIDKIAKNVENEFAPSIELFNNFKKKYSNTPLTAELDEMADKIAFKTQDLFGTSPSSGEYKYGQKLIEELPFLRTITDLSKRQTQVWNAAKKGEIEWSAAGQFVGILREAEENAIFNAVKSEGKIDVMELALARADYAASSKKLSDLNQFLKLKNYQGPESFVKTLKDAQNEKILANLTKENNAELLRYLQTEMPQIAGIVKEYQVDDLLRTTLKDGKINVSKLKEKIDKMSPEFRDFTVGNDSKVTVDAVNKLIDAIPDRLNPSGSGSTIADKMIRIMGSAAGGVMLLGGDLLGLVVGPLAKLVGKDAPDAVNAAMLKFMGSDQPIESEAFKAMVDFVQTAVDGQNKMLKATKSVFDASKTVAFTSGDIKTEKLDKQVQEYSQQFDKMLDVGGKTGYYLPQQGQSIAATTANTISYLSSLKPYEQKKYPLDKGFTDPVAEKNYKRALTIAEQPLILTNEIKKGTLTSQDVRHLKNLYPALYNSMSTQMFEEIVKMKEKDKEIPYVTKMGVSLFLGQPLDSSMSPESIMQNQPMIQNQEMSQDKVRPSQKGLSGLDKMSDMYSTSLERSLKNKQN